MSTTRSDAVIAMDDPSAGPRAIWRLGDYHRFAKRTVWQMGPVLVRACGIRRGQRVLDVAAGTGNTAIPAAATGAQVVASDITPENFEAGRREAASQGVELEWVEADVRSLPFEDGEFDVVTSSFGAIFAPDHQSVADEMLRVCKPGGTIGMLNFRAEGLAARFFTLIARYAPPPPEGGEPPLLWGEESHVRALFGDAVRELEMIPGEYVESAATPEDYRDLFQESFGPVVALREALAGEPDRLAEFDRDFLQFAREGNRGGPGAAAEYPYPYMMVIASKVGA